MLLERPKSAGELATFAGAAIAAFDMWFISDALPTAFTKNE